MDTRRKDRTIEQQIAVKKAYGSRGNYVIRKSIRMAIFLPMLVIFLEQFVLTLIFENVEFNESYFISTAVLWDFLWMAAASLVIFILYHWLEWNQSARISDGEEEPGS